VAFPTETVYGLGADAAAPSAVARVYAAKGRPTDHPLIVHIADPSLVDRWAADVPDAARALARACWPGPLTLVLRRRPWVPDAVTGGRDTVALRVPHQPVALALLERSGLGIAAPSANRFGRVSPTTAADVAAELGDRVDLILDGGPCRVGVESTIVEVLDADVTVLRVGGTPLEQIEEVVGRVERTATGPARAPGMLAVHYAPSARVVTVATPTEAVETATALIGEGRTVAVLAELPLAGTLPPGAVELSPVGDTEGYARFLYRRMREADELGCDVLVAVVPDPAGLGAAVRDRLARAAARG
jgi:L-threonylcarbamoyladenylate synthase